MLFSRVTLVILFLLSSIVGFAEGSKNLFPSPNPNPNAARAYLNDGAFVFAWAKPGETIYIGSSAQGFGNGRIIITSPTGVVTSTTIGSTVGRIATRAEELLGPSALAAGGYNAFAVPIPAGGGGIWKFQFITRRTGGDNGNPGRNNPDVAFETQRNNFLAAFDVTVANGSTVINGRAYVTVINGNMGGWNFGTGSWWSTLYAQTRDGFRYTVNTNGMDPFGFQFFVNNKGVRSPAGAGSPPSYISANSTSNGGFVANGLDIQNPDAADDVSNVTHKLFFNNLAPDLPASAPVFIASAGTTWLVNTPLQPVVNNVFLTGIEGQAGFAGTPPLNGGFINFTANQNGTYRIRIDCDNNGTYTDPIDTILSGIAAAGPNARFWSGKNGFGVAVPSGTPVNIEVITFAGEVHFPLFDSEENVNGLIITRINGSGAPNDFVFWNDTRLRTSSNTVVSANASTSNPLNASLGNGISSSTNGHRWANGNQDIPSANQGFGNQRLMDTWAYVFSAPITVGTVLVAKEADLEITSLQNNTNNICVGTDVTYTFTARNNGPDDAPQSKISFVAPTNLSNLQLVSATVTNGVAAGLGGTFTGNTFNDTLTAFNNGAAVTYVIRGTVTSWPSGNNLTTSARILRPADITDPDATNPDPAPPTDPVNECNASLPTVCNNIKNNTITVFAPPTISVAAAQTSTLCNASSFTMAGNAPTQGTGLWSLVTGTATIVNPTLANTTVTGVPAGTSATLRWTISNGTCTPSSSTVTITNTQLPTVAAAGSNQTNCNNGSFVLAANTPTVGTGSWSVVSGTANIVNPSAPNSAVNGVPAGTAATLRWTVSNGVCPPSTSDVILTNNALPTTANAGTNLQNCNSGSFTMAANVPSIGVGTWSIINGTATIANINSATTAVTGVPVGTTATLRWTITNGNCAASSSDVVLTNFANPTTATAGNNQVQCGNGSFTLGGNTPTVGTGIWTITNGVASIANTALPNTSVTGVLAGSSVTLQWTISNGTCASSSSSVTLTNLVSPNSANAGSNQTNCNNGSFSLTANTPAPGTTGSWSVLSGVAVIANVNNASTTVTGVPSGTSAVLQWQISNGICTPSVSTITLTNNALPTVSKAGNAQTLCNSTSTTLAANTPTIGTGVWSQVSGPNTAVITNPALANTTVSSLVAGTYVFRWTISNANCTPSSSDATVAILPPVNAGADRVISCSTATTLTAAAAGETWAPANNNPSNAIITNGGAVSGLNTLGTYKFILANAACFDTVNVVRINCAPTATPATNSGNEDTPIGGTLAGNGADFDGDVLTFSVANQPNNGSIVIRPDGTYTYTPNPNFNGVDTVIFRVCDAAGACVTQRLIITVNTVNDPPIAVNDNNTTPRDVPVSGNVSTNDSDIDNGTLTVQTTPAQNPANGTVVLNANGNYTYTPNPGFVGLDSFRYTICDPGPLCNTATVYINVTAAVMDLTITKTSTPNPAFAGAALTYTITIRNSGPSTIQTSDTFLVRDNIPAGFIATSFTPSAGTYNSATGGFTGITLAPNATATLTIVGTVQPSYTAANLVNTATATPPTGATDPTPTSATNTVPVSKRASIVVTKTSSGTTFVPGTNVIYTITAVNNGPSDVVGATVVDALPAGITSASWTAITSGGATIPAATGSGAINQTVNMPNGGRIVYTLTVAVPPSFSGTTLSNTATVNFPADVTNTTAGSNTATETDTRNRVYDIAIVKTAPSVATAGGSIRFQISVSNNGPSDLVNATIADVVPASVTGVTWSVQNTGTATATPASGTGNSISLNATIPAGSANRLVITIDGTISAAATGVISNTASITPPDAPTIGSNTTTTQVQTITGLQIVKAGPSSNTVIAGEPITFSIEVINAGPSNAVGAAFSDNVPSNIQNVTWRVVTRGDATATASTGVGNAINFTTNIPAGNNNGLSIIVTGTVASNTLTNIINTATITPTSGPASTSQSITAVINKPRLQIVKDAPSSVVAGTPITFTLVVNNVGSSDAFNVAIADTLPSNITGISYTASATGAATIIGANTGTGNIVGINANIPTGAGNTVTITINGIVDAATTGAVSNVAACNVPGGTPVFSNTTFTDVLSIPRLQIVKTAPATSEAGAQMSYVLRVTNNGPSNAYGVVISDTISTDLTNVTVSSEAIGTGTIIGSTSIEGGNRVVARNISIPAGNGNAVLITITGIINPAFTGSTIVNTATAQAPNVPAVTSNQTTTNVSVRPGLRIAKSGNTAISAGQRISYTVTVTNVGPSNANGITIIDNVPATIKNVSWLATATGTGATVLSGASGTGNTVQVTGNILANLGNRIDITITGIVDSSFAGTISNTASVSGGGSPAINSNTVQTTVNKTADLIVDKTAPTINSAGDLITYNIVVQNQGPSRADNIVISDVVSPEITNVTWVATATGNASIVSGGTGSGNTIAVTANISNNSTSADRVNIAITGRINPATAANTIQNIATATPAAGTTDPTPAADTVNTIVNRRANLQVSKVASPVNGVNQTITYTIAVTNGGPAAVNNFVVTDTIPATITGVAFTTRVSNNASVNAAVLNGNTLTINGNIGANAADTLFATITGILSQPGTVANTARVTAPTDVIETNPTDNVSTVSTNVTNQANIIITKTGPPTARVNQTIQYRIDVNNTGISDANGVVIIDTVPAALTNVSWSIIKTSGGTGTTFVANTATNQNTINVTANLQGSINGAGGLAILVTGTLANDAPASITNNAFSTFNGSTKGSSVTTAVDNTVDLVVQKTAPATLAAGSAIQYSITAYNNGPADAINARILDTVAASITNVSWVVATNGSATLSSGSTTNGTGNNILVNANLPSGANNNITITINGIVAPSTTGSIVNTARALPSGGQNDSTTAISTVNTTVTQQSNILINKTGPTTIAAGSTITYTVTVNNNGPSDANGIAVSDVINSNISNVSYTTITSGNATVTAGANGTGNTINSTVNIAAGASNSVTFTITGVVNPSFTGTIPNTASATLGANTVNSPTVNTTVTASPSLAIKKSGPTTIVAGETVTYVIDVTNSGPSNANNITVSDAVASSIINATWAATALGNATVLTGANGSGNTIAVTGNVNAGSGNAIRIVITGLVNPAFTGAQVSNFAVVTGGGSPPINSDTILTSVARTADITIQKIGPASIVAGQAIRYSIIVRNNGASDATGITIADNVPTDIVNTTFTATAFGAATVATNSGTGNTISLLGDIPVGAANYIEIIVNGVLNAASTATSISNTATATLPPGITDPTPAVATTTATVSRQADVAIVKSGPGDLATNQTINYTLTIINNGPSNATGITITDVIPASITGVAFTTNTVGNATVSSTNLTGNTLTVVGSIGSGADTIKVNITGIASSAGTITNSASVVLPSNQTDPTPTNNTSSVTTSVTTQANLTISKRGPATVNVNDDITYQIEVANTGVSDALGVLITDVVSPDITNVTWSVSRINGNAGTIFTPMGIQSGNTINVTADIEGTINGPGAILITINGKVANNAASTISNTAQLDYAGVKQSSVVTIVNNSVDLTIQKNGPATVNAGERIRYTLVVGNRGPANATNISINDLVPSTIENVTYTAVAQGNATVNTTSGTGNNIVIIGNINSGANNAIIVTIEGTVNVGATGVLNNTATATPNPSQIDPTPALSSVSTTITNAVNFTLNKAAPTTAVAGSDITYTITASNFGPSNANNIGIVDVVPTGITNVTWSATTTGTASVIGSSSGTGNSIVVNGNLPAGGGNTITITIRGMVNANFTGTLANTATLNYNGGPAATANTTTTVSAQPGLRIVKGGTSLAAAGTQVSYTIDVTNVGPSNANGITIIDAVAPQIRNVRWVATSFGAARIVSGNVGTGNNVSINANIAAADTNRIRVLITGTIDSSFSGNISNTATVAGGGSPTVTSNTVPTVVNLVADISMVKSAPQNAVAGNGIQYTLVVKNNGPSQANNISISDVVSAQITNVTWVAAANGAATVLSGVNGTGNTINITGNISTNPSTDFITVQINGTINAATTAAAITNTATVSLPGNYSDPVPGNNTSTTTTNVAKLADVRIVKVGPANRATNQTITYTLAIVNQGPSVVNGLTITDVVPAGIGNVSAVASVAGNATANSSVTGNTVTVTGNIGAAATDTIKVTITGVLLNSGLFTNTATVALPNDVTDPVLSNNTSTVNTQVDDNVGITISKTAPAVVNVNDRITYVIDVANTGISNATNVVISDIIPASITNVNWSVSRISGSANTNFTLNSATNTNTVNVTANIEGTLNGGGAIRIVITGTVANNAPATITNTATAVFAGTFTSVATTAVNNSVDLQITKTAPPTLSAGMPITYTITTTNNGPANAVNAVMIDTVNANITNVSWVATTQGTATLAATQAATGTGNIVNVLGNIPRGAGNAITITITGVTNPNFTGVLTNTAFANPASNQTDPTPAVSIVQTNIVNTSNVQVTKAGPSTVLAGNTVTYTVVVNNSGPSNATNISITDVLSSQLQNATWRTQVLGAATISNGASGTGNFVSVAGSIPVGTGNAIIITVTGTVNPSFTGTIANTANVLNNGVNTPSNTVNTTVTNAAALQINKTGAATIHAGERMVYTLEIVNNGPSNSNGFTIADVVPATLSNVVWSTNAVGNASVTSGITGTGNTISIVGNIAAGVGNTIRVTISGIVNPSFTGTFTNTATVTTPFGVVSTSPTVTTTASIKTNIAINKTAAPTVIAANQLQYTILVSNSGPSTAQNVTITDVVPTTLTGVTFTATAVNGATVNGGTTATGSGNTISLTAVIPANPSSLVRIVVTGTVNQNFTGAITNIATAQNTGEPTASDTAVTLSSQVVDLDIAKTAPSIVVVGNELRYRFVVSNRGPSGANGATFTDVFPPNIRNLTMVVVSTTGGAAGVTHTINGNTVNATIATFPSGGSVVFEIFGTAVTPGIISNTASITAPAGVQEPNTGNNVATAMITNIYPQPKLRISKIINPSSGPYYPGQVISYTISITNPGPVSVVPVTVVDSLPNASRITNVLVSTPSRGTASYAAATNKINWNVPFMEVGAQATLTYSLQLTDTGAINNTAIVSGPANLAISDTATVNITSIRLINLRIAKTLQAPTLVNVRDRINFTIEVENQGPNSATGVTVLDQLLANIDDPATLVATKGTATYNAATRQITWNIGTLALGERVTLNIDTRVIAGGVIENTATVSGVELETNLADNRSSIAAVPINGAEIFIPNVFTPNRDGKNDRFVILGINRFPGSRLTIYNRWGNVVYQNNNYNNQWDGSSLTEGTYFYAFELKLPSGEFKKYSGYIQLMR